jgi:cation diffusion facilitator CzcD-associated flavoprotein CzcO
MPASRNYIRAHTAIHIRFRPGAVLVVGSAQSGCQIVEELYQNGRRVYLCTGSAPRVLLGQ